MTAYDKEKINGFIDVAIEKYEAKDALNRQGADLIRHTAFFRLIEDIRGFMNEDTSAYH